MPRRGLALLVAFAGALAACSGAGGVAASTSTTTSSTTTASSTTTTSSTTTSSTTSTTTSTTTTLPPGRPSPLNGLLVEDEALLTRRAIAVKVDNHPNARPQSGLQEADAVIEILVEGGFTRFIALFQHSDSSFVGPVRSVRPTDSALLAALDPPFAQAGGMPWVLDLTVSRGIPLISEGSLGLFRTSHRRAPHNLYADTFDLRSTSDQRGYDNDLDGPLYPVGDWGEPAASATTITLEWHDWHTVTWTFQDGRYLRFEDGQPHLWVDQSGAGDQLAYDVLVVIVGRRYWAPDPAGTTPSLPSIEVLGSGRLLIFAGGRVLDGTWERDSVYEPFRFFDAAGAPVAVPPGVPWISVFPQQQEIAWS